MKLPSVAPFEVAIVEEWREARRLAPRLFYRTRNGDEKTWAAGPVRVWFQLKATEDGVIAAWLSDLWVEESDKFTLCSTDMVASEHSPELSDFLERLGGKS